MEAWDKVSTTILFMYCCKSKFRGNLLKTTLEKRLLARGCVPESSHTYLKRVGKDGTSAEMIVEGLSVVISQGILPSVELVDGQSY
jgi:hypothetical protein